MTQDTKAKKPPGYPKTTELDRMGAVKDLSHRIGEFIDWLTENGYHICQMHTHQGSDDKDEPTGCWGPHRCVNCFCGVEEPHEPSSKCSCRREVDLACGFRDGDYYSTHKTPEKLLADFFKIDLNKVENERRALLEWVQKEAEK